MAEATLGARIAPSRWREAVIEWALPRWEVLAIASLMAAALALRLWGLGGMALHHDESLHAYYSWRFYEGHEYTHNPLMHGPFLFHANAAVFFLFGDTDMTARLMPAVFGAALVGMPYLLRRQIGMPAVIIAAVLLMFSPTLLYFSRFIRNDIYIAVWTFGMVICAWRYLDEVKPRYLYALAALMALSFATKEVTFITVAIFLVFLDLMLAVELGKRRDGETVTPAEVARRTTLIIPFAWAIAGLWPLLDKRLHFGRDELPPIGNLMVVAGTLSLPQFAAGIQSLPFVGDDGYNQDSEDTLRVATVTSLLLVSLYAGLLWRPKEWLIAAVFFAVPYVLLYTTFLTHIDGFFSGIWGSLDYWLDQHHVKRGNQPQYYYALLTPLYEFLPLLLAAGGAAWLALRGDSLRRWLLFWLAGIFIGLTIAGEKMPWLETHIALPLALVAAISLAKAIDVLQLNGQRWLTAAAIACLTAAAVLLVLEGDGASLVLGYVLAAAIGAFLVLSLARGLSSGVGAAVAGALNCLELQVTAAVIAVAAVIIGALSLSGFVDPWFSVWVLALLPVAIVAYLLAGAAAGNKEFGRGLLAVGVAALLTLTVRASITASFTHDDTPVELLVYTQTAPDIPQLMDRIDALAQRSGLGRNLPVVVDDAESFAWPWAWYLRDYNSVSFTHVDADYEPPPGAVLLVNRANSVHVDASQYSQVPYKHRWWFNETYRELNFREAGEVLLDSSRRASLVSFFFHRRDESTIGSIDGVAFFPNDLSAFDYEPGPEVPPREPTLLADGRVLIGNAQGSLGSAIRGELWQPADLFVDGEGNLWVADGRNHRIQKFDAQGNFLAAFGRPGTAPGSFNEPWGVAVDTDGFIYVADTWNHRIQKFTPDFDFVTAWGIPGATDSDPLTFFGPRDIAIAPDGTLWITDTGNQRVLHFSPDGQPLDACGVAAADVDYQEPTSLTFDGEGRLLVASNWTDRILRFDATGELSDSFPVGWTSHEVLAKPYLTVLADGRIIATLPETGELVLFDSDGSRLGAWQPLAQSMPVGVVALPDGGFAFSDVMRNEIQVVPANLMDGFFE